jgi:hypothetical protein
MKNFGISRDDYLFGKDQIGGHDHAGPVKFYKLME